MAIVKQEQWLPAIVEQLHLGSVSQHFLDMSPIVQAGSAKIISTSSITTGTYTPGTDFTLGSTTSAATTMPLDKTAHWAIPVENIDEVQTNPDTFAAFVRDGAAKLIEDVDKQIFTLHDLCISDNAITGSSSAPLNLGSVDIYAQIVKANTKLTKAKAPLNNRWIVVTPEVHERMLTNTTYFTRSSAFGDAVVATSRYGTSAAGNATSGYVGQVAGMDVYVSNFLEKAGSSDVNAYLFYGQGRPIHFARQLGEVLTSDLPLRYAYVLKQLLVFGATVVGANTGRIGSIYVVNS